MRGLLWLLALVTVVRADSTFVPTPDPQTFIVHVKDFSAGMEPNVNHYLANDPSRIVLSQNMYSIEAGGRQLRHGYVELVDSASAAAAAGVSGVDAIATYEPAVGERKLMYAIGGKWLYGDLDTTAAKISSSTLIPYISAPTMGSPGDKLNWNGDSAWYTVYGARFLSNLQVGDTLSFGTTLPTTFQRRIRWIIDNKKVKFTSGGLTSDSGVYTVRRWYHNDSGIQPFYFQHGDDLFTGTKRDMPQVIYPVSATDRAIRPLRVADSLHIDTIYFRFGDTSTITRSFDTASDGREYLWVMQVICRNKGWDYDSWATPENGVAESFYFRFGDRAGDSINAMTYRIYGNTDTSLFLAAMFVDTVTNRSHCDTTARYRSDTLDFLGFVGGNGYIFSTAGEFKTVHTGASPLRIYGGGAVLVTNDTLARDSMSGVGGMYFVRPLEDVAMSLLRFLGFSVKSYNYPCGTYVTTPPDWELLSGPNIWYDHGKCLEKYTYRISRIGGNPNNNPAADRYQALNNFTFFPILDLEHKSDSMYIRSGLSFDPAANVVTITHWEIVRADMPMFSNMTEFRQQLYAWGDTTAPGTVSRSKPDVPGGLGVDAWSANDDIFVGDNPSKAVVGAAGYDDQLIIGQKDAVVSTTDGAFFSEISHNLGFSSPRAIYLHNKEFWFGSDDGVYFGQRRDLVGYSIQKISAPLDPVFNRWNATEYGTNAVPFAANRALIDQSIMTFNKRDQHLYYFFAEGSATYNNRCVAYDITRNVWDGYFTFGAGAAISASFHDTTRLIFGSPTGPVIYAYDYNWNDKATGIVATLRGAPFHAVNSIGWAAKSQLRRVWFSYRSSSGSIDSAAIKVIGDSATTVIPLTPGSVTVQVYQSLGWGAGNYSLNWQWEIYFKGKSVNANVFKPLDLILEFMLGEEE